MSILYIANIRFPTEKAHGLQIAKTCEAFARLGHEVELMVTDRATPITEEAFSYYRIKTTFPITRIHVPDTVRFGHIGFWLETYRFARGCLKALRTKHFDVLYGRDELVLAHIGRRIDAPIVWETHVGADNRCTRFLARRAIRVVAITQGLKDFYIGLGVPAGKIVVAPDGVDPGDFEHTEGKENARRRLGLPQDKKIAMYIGRLDGWKGSDTFLEASALLPGSTLAAVIGGEPQQVAAARVRYPDVVFSGYRPYRELPGNQIAADVLVLPNTAKDEVSLRFTSPLKLFTYMVSGVPMVVADLPSIREIVDEECTFFFTPDEPRALASAIEDALANDERSRAKAQNAYTRVMRYSWDARARAILEALK